MKAGVLGGPHQGDCGEFDAKWYEREYPDVGMTGMSPVEHYNWIGRDLNRSGRASAYLPAGRKMRWCVMCTQHTLFLAGQVARGLRRHGYDVDVTTESSTSFNHDFYVVLCPQMFSHLPPGEKRICYQLEQSVSSRWFSREYFSLLENSYAVWDYALRNIEFLQGHGIAYPHVYYQPVGADSSLVEVAVDEKLYDVLFYGDYKSSPRRREMLSALEGTCDVKVVDDVFGADVHEIIRRSRVVLNLHYYENALLEMPRIQEVLSHGTPVLSEDTTDTGDYPWLDGAVRFFKEGDTKDLLRQLKAFDEDGAKSAIHKSVKESEVRFQFMLDRFLLASGFLDVSACDNVVVPEVLSSGMISVSLPETVHRRRIFEKNAPADCSIFDGIRMSPGWIGCGLSYKTLCAAALRQGTESLTIVEDDVLLGDDFERRLGTIRSFLKRDDVEWDIFSGVIACLHPDTEVLNVEHYDGIDFITINRMTSMVFNIYNRWAMQLIAHWSPRDMDVDTNTIDRYLENANLRVVVAHPYIVGHREEVNSTLWNFSNSAYADMIAQSEKRLGKLKEQWQSRRPISKPSSRALVKA